MSEDHARERLQRFLSRAGVASRRHSEELILAGRVTVNGRVAHIGDQVEASDQVSVDGRNVRPSERPVTYMLYKPRDVLTTASDELGRRTVLDMLPRARGLHPVGRLDRYSEGLLLVTTDGDLTMNLTHPRFEHEKEYAVWTSPLPTARDLQALRRGVMLEDGLSRPDWADAEEFGLLLQLHEGRNRQVRRTMDALGFRVRRLLRTRIGGLTLGDFQPGEWRELTEHEVALALERPGR